MKHVIEGYEIADYDDKNYVVRKGGAILGYHHSLPSAVRYVAERTADEQEDLRGWLSAFTSVLDGFTKIVKEFQ
jgi:hypothetical protein